MRIQTCSVHQAQQWNLPESISQLGLSPDTTGTSIVHKQTNRDCASRATTTLTTQLHQACSTNKEKKTTKTLRRVSKTSSTWAYGQTSLHFSICACHPNTLPINVARLSHNSIGHGVVGVNMVVKGCSSQQNKRGATINRRHATKRHATMMKNYDLLSWIACLEPFKRSARQ